MGGAGGGGSSGAVAYPAYVEAVQESWLGLAGPDNPMGVYNISQLMLDNISDPNMNPFYGESAYNPAASYTPASGSPLKDMEDAIGTYTTALNSAFSTMGADYDDEADTITVAAAWGTEITSAMTAFEAIADAHVSTDVLPRFKAGMHDINAVQTSAFTLGQSYIEAANNRDISNHQGKLRLMSLESAANVEVARRGHITQAALAWMDQKKSIAHYTIEAARMAIVALKEQNDKDIDIEDREARWDFEVYQYGANVMAAGSGGTVSPAKPEISTGRSVIGGALSGASAGAKIGGALGSPGIGAGIGAIVGGLAGLL